MAGWLDKASSMWGGGTAVQESAPSFQVTCECGQVHHGMRRRSSQRIVCRDCGAAMFIVAWSPYPKVKQPKKRREAQRTAGGEVLVASSARSMGAHFHRGTERVGEWMLDGGLFVRRGIEARAWAAWQWLKAAVKAFRHWWTPLRLVIASMLVLVAVTGIWKLQSRRVEAARRSIDEVIRNSVIAIEGGELIQARDNLRDAVNLLNVLDRHDGPALGIRTQARETEAIVSLSALSIPDMLDDAERVLKNGTLRNWESLFDGKYKGAWVILDSPVTVRETSDERLVSIDLPLGIGPALRDAIVLADVSALSRLQPRSETQQVIFAAQVDRCWLSEAGDEWRITLNPRTAFLWAHLETYQAAGFTFDAWRTKQQVSKLIKQQAASLGVEPWQYAGEQTPSTTADEAGDQP